ncbi:hypothetical protein FB45DRAFT_1021462 [Roridomyces roridus]|uniref:F-box domain-containing protein n=1 Tax=Roridomyces roridus TaxID=1738132 RepID=A0AAD7CC93_9AGAR|nr:hypothetical protein FB45DRAFT_1021462 [Roridomyces roridus]
MSSHERVPNEVWLEVFELLPRDSLKHVHATHRMFRSTSRPLLFSHLLFRPYFREIDELGDRFALPDPEVVQRTLDRLEFWSSNEIAPLVRQCTINLLGARFHTTAADSVLPEPTESPHTLMISFMDHLSKFTGLKKLRAHHALFTQAGIVNLCQLPLLREVVTKSCNIVPGETIDTRSLQLRTAKLLHRADVVAEEDKMGAIWLSIVDRESLHEFEVTGRSFSGAGYTISEGPAFPNVHHLQFSIDLSTMNRNLTTLSKFPAVRKVCLSGWGDFEYESTDAPLHRAPDVLPLLQEYSGSCTPLHMFLPRPTLTCLSIHWCTPDELSSQLREEYTHITSLDAGLSNLDQQTLDTISTFLPELTELRLQIFYDLEDDDVEDGFNPKATNFFSTLVNTPAPQLPPNLRRLAISWEFDFEFLSDAFEDAPVASPDSIPHFLAMRDKLRERCPALTTLWFDGRDFMFWWRLLDTGEEIEQENKTEGTESYRLRRKFRDFWAARSS